MTNRSYRHVALAVGLLLLALPFGVIGGHSHPEGTGKTCTLCQAPQLPGSFTGVAGLSRPVLCAEQALPREVALVVPAFDSSRSSRGPPITAAAC